MNSMAWTELGLMVVGMVFVGAAAILATRHSPFLGLGALVFGLGLTFGGALGLRRELMG